MVDLPDWTTYLKNYYVGLRVGKRNKALRRMYYRKIEKEKLRLVEQGICQGCVISYCRYLSNLKTINKCPYCSVGQMWLRLN
jgi:hypothetical protein